MELPREILTAAETAELLGIDPRTLRRWRVEGAVGPSYLKTESGRILYTGKAIRAWLEKIEADLEPKGE